MLSAVRRDPAVSLTCSLPPRSPSPQFDAVIKPLVQGVERSEPQGFKQRCDADFLLEVGC